MSRKPYIPADFSRQFRARTKLCREAAGYSQGAIAKRLGIERDTYAKYESRSPLPHHLVAPFVALTGVSYDYLFAGKAASPPVASDDNDQQQRRTA